MAFDFHKDRNKYFGFQHHNSQTTIVPLVEKYFDLKEGSRVLEVGCRDGGVLYPFLEKKCHITGFDLDAGPVEQAKERYKEAIEAGQAEFFVKNVHDYVKEFENDETKKFDVIVLKDVIEHVYGHQEMINGLKLLLRKNGVIYFGFPPWQNPYGGHQQVLSNKFLALLPYYHLLPNFIYYGIIKTFEASSFGFIKATKDTQITPEKFEKIVKEESLQVRERILYLVSPMYQYKFNLKPRVQFDWLAGIPYLRNYFTTTCDYIVSF